MPAQMLCYDWRLDDAAMVFGARPLRCFWEIALPNIWPAMLGAFVISFILAFNTLEISFYNPGAPQTLCPRPPGAPCATAWGPSCRRSPRWSTPSSSSPSRSCIS